MVMRFFYAAAVGASVVGAVVGYQLPVATLAGIFPYILRGAEVGATAGAVGAGAIAGLLLIVVSAVTTGIVAGGSVVNEAAIPGQLQEWLDVSRSYDVGAIIRYNADLPENV